MILIILVEVGVLVLVTVGVTVLVDVRVGVGVLIRLVFHHNWLKEYSHK